MADHRDMHPRIAAWLEEPEGPSSGVVAGKFIRASLLPIMDPQYNLREVCKQLVLLEDHLFQPAKRCIDCIRKHLLTAEALAEETVTLDTDGTYRGVTETLADHLRDIWTMLQHRNDPDGPTFEDIAQAVRKLRKPLAGVTFYVRVASDGSTLHDPGACPAQVAYRKMASYFSPGDVVLYGKYKNKKGRIVKFDTDEKGDPTVEIEPVPKGRKQNKILKLFKIRRIQKMQPTASQLALRVVNRYQSSQTP